MKRREFLLASGQLGTAGLALNLLPAWSSALASTLTTGPVSALSKAGFEKFLNQIFSVKLARLRSIDLELTEIKDGPVAQGLEQFHLIFAALHPGQPLKPNTYTLIEPHGNAIQLYLEPLEPSNPAEISYYQASFNLLINT
jgi:hypothetical protein